MQNRDLIDYYQNYFYQLSDFSVIKKFEVVENYFSGVIKAHKSICELIISVQIPFNYPYEEIVFATKSIKGYPHLIPTDNGESFFCLNSPFVPKIEDKLNLDIQRLTEWIIFYLNNGKKDNHYDYPIIAKGFPAVFFFSEPVSDNNAYRFNKEKWGKFTFYATTPTNHEPKPMFFADNLGNFAAPWQPSLKHKPSALKGYWIYIDSEPTLSDGSPIYTWDKLETLFLNNELSTLIKGKLVNNNLPDDEFIKIALRFQENDRVVNVKCIVLAIGYDIPTSDGNTEIHWEFLFIYHSDETKEVTISWVNSKNISIDRFFGRGGFGDFFCNLNILIIGVGAIGSNLAEILVRGGVRNLSLQDGDVVEHGNICRGNFHLWQANEKKALSLAEHLTKLSPFINLKFKQTNFSGKPPAYCTLIL